MSLRRTVKATLTIDVDPADYTELGLIEQRVRAAVAELHAQDVSAEHRIFGRRTPRHEKAGEPRAFRHSTGALRRSGS
ncbi:MAG TPA: hypothetical protein VED40_03580 [Azospirillaceae bacterium]|nr:hypothetical protein [Azospirillaceae bacterium]